MCWTAIRASRCSRRRSATGSVSISTSTPITPGAEDKVAALGLDHLVSDNRFFDVLPKGVSKGPSLKRLVAHLGVSESRVLAAGDTLNDLSMLECGIRAVAVGGAEAALLERVSHLDHVFTATDIGAAGILEAIAALDLHPTPKG
jgi:hydroxymethylpyrimidine pyrophosphatase-like HAD family hydrolase